MISVRTLHSQNSKDKTNNLSINSSNISNNFPNGNKLTNITNIQKILGNQSFGNLLKSRDKVNRQVFIDELENMDTSSVADDVNVITPGESIPVIWFNQNTLNKRNDEHVSSRENFRVLLHAVKQHLDVVGLNADIKFRGYESILEMDAAPGLSKRRAEKVRDDIINIFYDDLHLRFKFANRSEAIGMGTDDSIEGEEWNQRVDVELQPRWEKLNIPDENIGKTNKVKSKPKIKPTYSDCIVIEQGGGMRTLCLNEEGGFHSMHKPSKKESAKIVVTAIDINNPYGFLSSMTYLDKVYMSDIKSMVDGVIEVSGGKRISRLNIIDHGNTKSIQIGNDRITKENVYNFEEDFSKLFGRFTSDGFVHIQHCKVGQNLELVTVLAEMFGVPVYAGTGEERAYIRHNMGDYVRCNPDGNCEMNVDRP